MLSLSEQMQLVRAGAYNQNPNPAGPLALKDQDPECGPEVRERDP